VRPSRRAQANAATAGSAAIHGKTRQGMDEIVARSESRRKAAVFGAIALSNKNSIVETGRQGTIQGAWARRCRFDGRRRWVPAPRATRRNFGELAGNTFSEEVKIVAGVLYRQARSFWFQVLSTRINVMGRRKQGTKFRHRIKVSALAFHRPAKRISAGSAQSFRRIASDGQMRSDCGETCKEILYSAWGRGPQELITGSTPPRENHFPESTASGRSGIS